MFSKELTIGMMKVICDFAEKQIKETEKQCEDYIYTINELKQILNVNTNYELIDKVQYLFLNSEMPKNNE